MNDPLAETMSSTFCSFSPQVESSVARRVTVGQFRWSVMGGDGTARLIGRSEVVSGSRKVSSTYSCPVCCPYFFNGISLNPGSFTTGPGGSVTILVDGFEIDCYANIIGPFPCYANECSSSNPSVLSAVLENGHIRADGVSPGQATITGYHQDMVYWDDGMDCYGFLMNFAADCMGEVDPQGACCLDASTGNCVKKTAAECSSLGGTYYGDNTTCGAGINWQCCQNKKTMDEIVTCDNGDGTSTTCINVRVLDDDQGGFYVDARGVTSCNKPDGSPCVQTQILWQMLRCASE